MMVPPEQNDDSDPLAVQIGQEIVKARTAAGLSVVELHRQTGISRTVIQGYERGRYKPGASELKRLAEVLRCSPNRLLFGHDDFKKPSTLDLFFGGEPDAAENALAGARAGVLFALLTPEERHAVMTLVVRLLESRVGGDSVRALLAMQSVVEGEMKSPSGIGGEFFGALERAAPDLLQKAEAAAVAMVERPKRGAKKRG